MSAEDTGRHLVVPAAGPFPPAVPRLTEHEFLDIVYRTHPDAARDAVPEPLRMDEPLVRFFVMKVSDTGFGPFTRAGQTIQVSFDGERGRYLHAVYLDNFPATTFGCDINSYRRIAGTPKLYVDSGALVGTLDYGSLRVATATMGYKHYELDVYEAEAEIAAPRFSLKIVPSYDSQPCVQELVRTEIRDVVVKSAWTGPARLQLFQHVLAPLADLPVLEVVSATHIHFLTDMRLAWTAPVHDYLAGERR